MTDAILFDREQVEHLEDLRGLGSLRGSKLLWVDIHVGSDVDADEVGELFALDAKTTAFLSKPNYQAVFDDHAATSTSRPTLRATTKRASSTRSNASSARTG